MLFIGIESLLYVLIIIYQFNILKYMSIFFCFLYTIFKKKGYEVLCCVFIADYFLLWTQHWLIGIAFFIIVQCYYHHHLSCPIIYYFPLIFCLYPSVYSFAFCYALLSMIHIIVALYKKDWLVVTLVLLSFCDLCIVFQYLFHTCGEWIWIFYLPSQVYYVKMVSLHQMKPLKRNCDNQCGQ